ncbi:MAG TPA: GNAT family N-acetyltransferase, partial [Rugosimonospora sp.]|nr:GNAT family N-acetyltransferase [Rugosimonospora sp.]
MGGSADATVIRAATATDLPGVRAVADSYGLLDAWPAAARDRPADFLDAELAFGRLTVAVTAAGEITGFCGTQPRGALTHLGDLFVRTGEQSRGLGAALLARTLDGAGSLVTFASADP